MVELKKFCPRCGKETEQLYGDEKKLCPDCYPDKYDLLDIPNVIEITICSVCGRMRKQGEWIEKYALEQQILEKLAEYTEKDVEMEIQYWEEDEQIYSLIHAHKPPIKDEYKTRIDFQKVQCKECSKFEGGHYKVKIQLRGDNQEKLEQISNEIADKAAEITNKHRKQFLSNIEKMDNGYDFYLSTESMNKKILNQLRSKYDPEIKRSYELIGEKDGEKQYRNVVSVRID